MSGRGIPLTAINGGMNRLRVKGAARKDTLYQLTNAYVTAGNTIKPRGGTIRNANLAALATAGSTKGLVAHQGALHVFSSAKVTVPAGYVDHVLSHPAVQATYVPPFPGVGYNPIVNNLLQFENGNGSTTFTDGGINPVTWTSVGGAVCSTAQAKFGSGALLCNSTTQYISCPVNPGDAIDLITGQGDWTIEFWVYVPVFAANTSYTLFNFTCAQTTLVQCYWQTGAGSTVTLLVAQTSGTAGVGNWGNASSTISVATPAVAGQWHHVAICRDGDVLRLFLNGVSSATTPFSSMGGNEFTSGLIAPAIPASSSLYIGGAPFGGNQGTAVTMYIDCFRITKGACLYGGPFTPPSAQLTTTPDTPYTICSLQHFDDGAGSTAFTDSTGGITWVPHGAASEVAAPVKFGASAGAFVANADYLQVTVTAGQNSVSDLTYGSPDFTVEGFIYPTDVTSGTTHIWWDFGHKTSSTSDDALFQVYNVAHDVTVRDVSGGFVQFTAVNALPSAGQWYHMAVVRRGGYLTLFINGIQVGQSTGNRNGAVVQTGAQWYLSSRAGATGCNGYQDEFRIIKNFAVYRANFTPPAAPYTVPGYVPIALLDIHFAAPFMGFLYVVAEFVSDGGSGLGTVFHYWLQTSGKWLANTLYQVGQIISPNVDNGLTYRAERFGAPNPAWAASTLKAVNDKVEPTVPNGFLYTATVVDGGNPITGTTEPTWPIVDGGVVYEESEKTGTGEVATPAPQPALTSPSPGTGGRYINPYRTTVIG